MKLIMTLLVRNEEDILDANLRWHLDQGVDHFVITNNLSTDLTATIIERYVARGLATLIEEDSDSHEQGRWVTRMARLAATELGADWVINNDADEFWCAQNGSTLKAFFSGLRYTRRVYAERHDFICPMSGPSEFWRRMRYRKAQSLNPSGEPLPPKVAHRASPLIVVGDGNHKVHGFNWPGLSRQGLAILHFPLRSREQYLRKITLGGQALRNNTQLPAGIGYTWRRQLEELEATGTLQYLDQNLWSDADIAAAMERKEIILDTRLEAFMSSQIAPIQA